MFRSFLWHKITTDISQYRAILVSGVWVSALIRFSYSGWRVVVFCSGTADRWHWSNSDGTQGGDRDQEALDSVIAVTSLGTPDQTILQTLSVNYKGSSCHEPPVSRRPGLVQVQSLPGREAPPRQEHRGAPHHHRRGVTRHVRTQKWASRNENTMKSIKIDLQKWSGFNWNGDARFDP